MLEASITQWMTQGRISKRILDCFRELIKMIDQICLIFLNPLVLQREGATLVDIRT